jgi:hypothetical protein
MARGYLDHEAGQVRDTDFKALKDAALTPLEKHVWNTLEDYRVEHKLASIFPGCRQNFDWLIGHVFGSEAQDEHTQPAAIILNWLLLEVRSWDVQALSSRRDILAGQVDMAFQGVRPKIEHILRTVRTRCRSTRDAIDFAREIVRVLDQYANSTEKPVSPDQDEPLEAGSEPNEQNGSERSEQNAPGAQDENSDQSECRGESQQDEASDVEGDQDGWEESDDADASASTPDREGQGQAREHVRDLLGAGEEALPQSLGDILADTLEVTSRQSQDSSVTVAIPTPKNAGLLIETDVLEARQASMALRTRLQGLLQTKILTRASSGVAIPVKHLDGVAPAVAEDEEVPGERVQIEDALDRHAQPVDTGTHVSGAGSEVDLGRGHPQHRDSSTDRSLASITSSKSAGISRA